MCLAITEQDLHKDVVEDLIAEDTVRYQPIAKNDSMSMADAIELYGKGKYKKAVMIFTQFATDGAATAQYILGGCYKNGLGVSQDYNEAVKWYRKSAEQGNAPAQNNLGDCYEYGRGVPIDIEEAKKWHQRFLSNKNRNE